jgi:type IV pilus assembly protein PilV
MHLKNQPMSARTRGFSLVEVLVALLVISIGLLGIAKMQALALSNTNGGRLRALASIEAASLAATMEAERNYWGNLTTNLTITVVGTPGANAATPGTSTITSSDTTQIANATVTCNLPTGTTIGACTASPVLSCTSTTTPCTAQKMAAYDLQQWAGRVQQVMGADAASITCSGATPPVSCQITINWAEQTVNSNATETGTMATPSYTLFVNP